MKFIIGSASERKINISKEVIQELFKNEEITVEGYAAKSGMPETPFDQETFDGAKNRALDSKTHANDKDFWIGLESGLVERYGHIFEEAWAAVIDKEGKEFYGYSSGLKVPDYILQKMAERKLSHSELMSEIEIEFDLPNETWGNYSGGMISREVSLKEALRNAILQIVANDRSFYKKK